MGFTPQHKWIADEWETISIDNSNYFTKDEAFSFDSSSSFEKSVVGTDVYDPSSKLRRIVVVGVAISIIFGIACLVTGIAISLLPHKTVMHSGIVALPVGRGWSHELLPLLLTLCVAMCTESIGFMHSVALRSALASESRLRFNTNLRLLNVARTRSWMNPNGLLCNATMSILLILSYTSSLLSMISEGVGYPQFQWYIHISNIPVIVLGVTILLQAVIAIAGIRATKVLTWSSSAFDMTAALVHHTQITPADRLCMNSVSQSDACAGPKTPSAKQPSAWQAHRSIRRIIILLWVLIIVCVTWGWIVVALWKRYDNGKSIPALGHWNFFPDERSNALSYGIPLDGNSWYGWIVCFANMAIVQGPLTLALHCSEVIVNVVRDESNWRAATSEGGTKMMRNPLKSVLGNWLNVVLLIAKPVLHWMFGLSLYIRYRFGTPVHISITMYTVQIWNLAMALLIFAVGCTIVALRRPRGPQPAAYGHIQTLANLIDEWSPTMWWGHKEDGVPYCHAGTSNHPLPDIKMDSVYAGS
ncbi:hypothetical protein BJ138DRAFT_1114999 [Hygrophoropsis aurantiaca]|uniref:Uncharacterized protein n=1 Tax=Hygrophoropsis aurantiaca TaxID=72124 RepID=A0ACB8A8U1_9AGAM|nr:hypothetical protein BJ138DRAFT_1114999 [Hygrophoropsis aurantiaca]